MRPAKLPKKPINKKPYAKGHLQTKTEAKPQLKVAAVKPQPKIMVKPKRILTLKKDNKDDNDDKDK